MNYKSFCRIFSHTILILSVSFLYGKPESHSEKVTFLGVSASTLPERMSEQLNLPSGIHLSVDQVSPGSPADSAGLKVYDVLLHFNDQILINSAQLKALVRMKRAGDLIDLKILRKGNPVNLKVTLSEVEKPIMSKNSHVFGLRNTDIFSGDPFSSNLDQIMPNLDPSIRDLLKELNKHSFSQLPGKQNRDPGVDPDNPLHGPNSNTQDSHSFTFSSEQKHITTSDEQGTLEYTVKNNKKHFRAISPDGEVLFDGPVTTDEEKDNLSPELKKRLEKVEKKF